MKHVTQLKAETLTTKQMADRFRQVSNDIRRYRDVEASSELAEFRNLQKIVETKEFQDYKHELLTTRYKDREEYRLIKDYERAKNSHHLRWFKFYRGLQKVQEYEHFCETSDFVKLNDPEAVKADPRLKRMQRLGNSFAVRRYRIHKASHEVSEYYRLREIVNNTEFRDRNHFWKNEKRWYTTLQSQQDGKYEALKNSSNIAFFLSQDPKQIERYEAFQEIFADALRDAAITVVVDESASFSYAALEALKTGNIVICKIPENTPDWMLNEKGELSDSIVWVDNLNEVPDLLANLVAMWIRDDVPAELYAQIEEKAKSHTREEMAEDVKKVFVDELFADRRKEIEDALARVKNNEKNVNENE